MKIKIGAKLRQARKDAKLAQKDVAKAIDVTVLMISRYENDKTEPTYENLYKMCQLYKISITDLFEEYNDYPNNKFVNKFLKNYLLENIIKGLSYEGIIDEGTIIDENVQKRLLSSLERSFHKIKNQP